MLFNSFEFIVFVLITFSLYYAVPRYHFQIPLLIVASFFFYAYHNPALLSLLVFSASINAISSYLVIHGNHRKAYASAGVITNLAVLLFFKYGPLFSHTFLSSTSDIGRILVNIPLPIGISFFTFQGISLCVDTFRNSKQLSSLQDASLIDHIRKTFFFKAFFPQLIAGPIVKAHDFYPQIKVRTFNTIDWITSGKSLIVGYFLKMVVADNLKDYTFWMAYPYFQTLSSLNLLTMILGYSAQIFADFAGYSLIAIGLAELFGYKLMTNFNFPYISRSFQEFWTRWHISLSTFLKEYLYIPLGGNRISERRTYFNLFITMVLGGLWHGAAWSYAIWGIFHGSVLAIERLFPKGVVKSSNTYASNAFSIIKIGFIFSMVSFAWLLFKLPEFSQVIAYVGAIFKNTNYAIQKVNVLCIVAFSFPVFFYHVIYLCKRKGMTFSQFDAVIYGSLLFFVLSNSGSPGSFVYFQF